LQIFIILGIVVNAGGNKTGEYIGGRYWHIGDAPFVGGLGGFASVFVTAAFACEIARTNSLRLAVRRLTLSRSRWRHRIHRHHRR
jgi:amino acid permease